MIAQAGDLWDFGLEVDIPVPDVPPREHEGLASVAAALWKMRRDWRREH